LGATVLGGVASAADVVGAGVEDGTGAGAGARLAGSEALESARPARPWPKTWFARVYIETASRMTPMTVKMVEQDLPRIAAAGSSE